MGRTKIDWCDWVINPVVGCTGSCPYCYARKMAHRFHLGRPDFRPVWVEKNFQKSLPRKPSAFIFVNSMSDLADWKPNWINKVSGVIVLHLEHLFLFLTKRPWDCVWPSMPNAMLGYSATRQEDMNLLLTHGWPRNVSFLSIEPLLDRVEEPTLWTPHWIICGAETGNRKGKVIPKTEWLREIFGYCQARGIPLFFKESLRPYWPAGAYFPQEKPEWSHQGGM